MDLTLHIWRQPDRDADGRFVRYEVSDVTSEMSFLEMLDVLNERLIASGKEPVAFDHDCREGICGACGFMINGRAHGPHTRTAVCQVHMRSFEDGDELWLEPWRAKAFPVVKDLVVDRAAFDRIIGAGGYVSVRTGSAPEANSLPVAREDSEFAFDAAVCIGCGACVAVCPNASAMLFTSSKIAHLNALPQGRPERADRVLNMILQHDQEGFGNCTMHGACQLACPKEISVDYIAWANREYLRANLSNEVRRERDEG